MGSELVNTVSAMAFHDAAGGCWLLLRSWLVPGTASAAGGSPVRKGQRGKVEERREVRARVSFVKGRKRGKVLFLLFF